MAQAAKQEVKAERKRKKMEKEEREWGDLEENEPLPDELKRQESTAPEHGGPSSKVKCKPGDHPIKYFRAFCPYDVVNETYVHFK